MSKAITRKDFMNWKEWLEQRDSLFGNYSIKKGIGELTATEIHKELLYCVFDEGQGSNLLYLKDNECVVLRDGRIVAQFVYQIHKYLTRDNNERGVADIEFDKAEEILKREYGYKNPKISFDHVIKNVLYFTFESE